MVGMLQRGEADVIPADLSGKLKLILKAQIIFETIMNTVYILVIEERRQVIDYTSPIYADIVTVFHKVDESEKNHSVYVLNFSKNVWVTIFILFMLFWIFAFCISKQDHSQYNKRALIDVFWFVFSCFIQQQSPYTTTVFSAKIIYITITISAFFLHSLYSALLTSSMVNKPKLLTLYNFKDIVNQGYDITVLENGAYHQLFLSAPPGTSHHEMVPKLRMAPNIQNLIKVLMKDKKVLVYAATIYWKDYPEIMAVRGFQNTRKDFYAFGLVKGSEFKQMIDHWLLYLQISGVISRMYKKWGIIVEDEVDHESLQAQSLDYGNVLIPFSLCAVGVFASAVFIAFEVMSKQLRKVY